MGLGGTRPAATELSQYQLLKNIFIFNFAQPVLLQLKSFNVSHDYLQTLENSAL